MATITSAASGLYSDGSTWSGGTVPGQLDDVILAGGYRVTVTGENGEAKTLVIQNGILRISETNMVIGADCRVGANGQITRNGGTGALVVGGDFTMRPGDGACDPAVLEVGGRTQVRGRAVTVTTLTAGGPAVVLGGSVQNTDASGGNRLVAYGSQNLGGNTNVDFYLARGARALLMPSRRAVLTGMVG